MICNPSLEDECGWDFHLQFPSEDRPGLPADMQSPSPEAFIQVKSKQKTPLTAKLKLSNALKACLSQQPHFLVLVIKDDHTEKVHLYSKHFWEPEITRSLKRVRQVESEGNAALTVAISTSVFAQKTNIRTIFASGCNLSFARRARTIPKRRPRSQTTVGFENDLGEMQFSITADVKDLEDWQIGLKKELPVTYMEITSKRFGIPLPMQPRNSWAELFPSTVPLVLANSDSRVGRRQPSWF